MCRAAIWAYTRGFISLIPTNTAFCKEHVGATLGTERTPASEHPSSRDPVDSVSFFFPASSPSPLVRQQSSLQAHNTRRSTCPNPSRFHPRRPSRLALSNNVYQHQGLYHAAAIHSFSFSFFSFLFMRLQYIYYSFLIAGTHEVTVTIQT